LERGIDLGELVLDAAVADLESLDFAEPSFAFRLDDAGFEVVADLDESVTLCGVRSQERASHASVFMDAG
jgi:phosphatidate phosphatase APP1